MQLKISIFFKSRILKGRRISRCTYYPRRKMGPKNNFPNGVKYTYLIPIPVYHIGDGVSPPLYVRINTDWVFSSNSRNWIFWKRRNLCCATAKLFGTIHTWIYFNILCKKTIFTLNNGSSQLQIGKLTFLFFYFWTYELT